HAESKTPKTYDQATVQFTSALIPRVQFAKHRIGLTMSPLPSAAFVAAAARIAPGRSSLSVVPACWQVTHTYTVAASADASMSVSCDCPEPTRAAPQGRSPESGCLVRSDRPRSAPPGHDRINGRSPGSRVPARDRLPGIVPSGNVARARRLQLRGQLRIWIR